MRILLAEDDKKMAEFIGKGLRQEGFIIDEARDGREALMLARRGEYDAAVLDVMMPELDGLEVLARLRAAGIALPVLFLSARRSVSDRVRGLQAGGDDYLVKPFAFSELVARIHALVRRAQSRTDPDRLETGELVLDLRKRKAFFGPAELVLQPRELALLEYLMRNQGRVVSKTMIMEHVWDYNFDPGTNVVEARVSRLRAKLSECTKQDLIHTVRGLGYVLEDRS